MISVSLLQSSSFPTAWETRSIFLSVLAPPVCFGRNAPSRKRSCRSFRNTDPPFSFLCPRFMPGYCGWKKNTTLVHSESAYLPGKPSHPRLSTTGSSGGVPPAFEAKIVDDGGRDVAIGEGGPRLVKGVAGAALYCSKHEQTKKT